jgi:hypothetical protein
LFSFFSIFKKKFKNSREKRLAKFALGCLAGGGVAHVTGNSKLAGCAIGGGGASLGNKLLKNRNKP